MTGPHRTTQRVGDDSWMEEAACRPTPSKKTLLTPVFFDDRGTENDKDRRNVISECLCENCPVKVECEEFAVNNIYLQGVWAGTTHLERKKKARAMRAKAS